MRQLRIACSGYFFHALIIGPRSEKYLVFRHVRIVVRAVGSNRFTALHFLFMETRVLRTDKHSDFT
jgi:hypothetical protein